MKKALLFLAAASMVANVSSLQAAPNDNSSSANQTQSGKAATTGTKANSGNAFAWGVGILGLAAIGTVVGVIAGSSSSSTSSSFSH